MHESQSSDSRSSARESDRDSRAEALLVEGLDHYLEGHYEDAIHVWTRVLFIDRGHQRARAYIERARSALGERQRHAEELLHRTETLVDQGALDQARDLLTEASQTGSDEARVASLWTVIDRAERAKHDVPAEPPREVEAAPAPADVAAAPTSKPLLFWVAVASVVVFVVIALWSPAVRGLVGMAAPVPPVPTSDGRQPAKVLAGAELALTRARTLFRNGRLAEALAVLDAAEPTTQERAAVDAFRVEIQSALLSIVNTGTSAESSEGGSQP